MKDTNWYVLFVMGGKENQLCEFLNQEENWYAFYPKIELVRRKNSIDYLVEKPLFPSYIFIESNQKHTVFKEKLHVLRSRKTGIVKELHYEDDIPALHSEEKEYLQALLNDDFVLKKSTGFIEQDHVVIKDGPLKGYESKISKINRHKRNAILEVELLHKKVNVTVPLEILKRTE